MKMAVTGVLDTFTLYDFYGAFTKWLELYNKGTEDGGLFFEED